MYKAASGDSQIIENFLGLSGIQGSSKLETINANGCNQTSLLQQQLYYNPNQLINTSIMTPNTQAILQQSVNPTAIAEASLNTQNNSPMNAAANYNTGITEGYQKSTEDSFPVYTVPGTYQSDISPRFNSLGLNSYVKYNPPVEKNMASYVNDPLTINHRPENYQPLELANMIEKPSVREDFKSCATATADDYNKMNKQLTDMGSEVHNQLPIQPMNGGSPSEEPIYYNADRYIFALQKSRLYGRGDFIRGDIPIIPCLPNSDKDSNVWFRPSVVPRHDLNAGALSIIGGVGNVTNQQIIELMGRSVGGSRNLINGVDAHIQNTALSNIENNLNNTLEKKTLNLNMSNQFNTKIDNNPPNLVQTVAFP